MNRTFILNAVFTLVLLGSFLSALPGVTSAAAGDTKVGDSNYSILGFECSGKEIAGAAGKERECNFKDLMTLFNRVIDFLLKVAFLLAVISFMYAGFLLITSGGSSDKVKHAKSIFLKVILGFIFAFLAWTIVHFILESLGVRKDYTLLE